MSVDNSTCVQSKYFVGKTGMDESLSDFQETKKSCKGPKSPQKPVKTKTKKVTKRIKGQKDIRTALKGKKNELVSYTKEFDTVCKKSGLDVDSEQLQLAIALSKSLQTDSSENPESSQGLSSQQRVAKIRKTLQEYGFKVPEAKITVAKKTKRQRKSYKLLTATEEEKRQIISKKYSQILFENLDKSSTEKSSSYNQNTEATIFHVASNILYKNIKDDHVFYVDNLVENVLTNGSLLRDWSEIPGRPESPKLIDTKKMNFKDLDCSQDELDIILSGPMKAVKDIFASKEIKKVECDLPKIILNDDNELASTKSNNNKTDKKSPFHKAFGMNLPLNVSNINSPAKKLFKESSTTAEVEIISPIKELNNMNGIEAVISVENTNKLTITQQYRSCSPDIFDLDDEISFIMDNTKPVNILSQEHKTKLFTDDNFMDLTQCAHSQNSQKTAQCSQNITKRRSNDFMEITECVIGSSQPIREELKEIDLTQSPDDKVAGVDEKHGNLNNVSLEILSNNIEENPKNSISQNVTDEQNVTVVFNEQNNDSQHANDNIDLTQSSNDDDKGTVENYQILEKKELGSMDLTESSSSNDIDGLPLVNISNSQIEKSLDSTIILNEEDYISIGKVKKTIVFENGGTRQVFDLTQAQDESIEYKSTPIKYTNTESSSNSFYEDFVHDHSENTDKSTENGPYFNNSKEQNNNSQKSDIDLTQESDTSEERIVSPRPTAILPNVPNNSSLGKRDDVSIDYDEILIDDDDNEGQSMKENKENSFKTNESNVEYNEKDSFRISEKSFKESSNNNSLNLKYDSSKEVNNVIEIIEPNNDLDINSSQNSDFNISDKELDYSLHKSRYDCPRDNFDFGGISVLNNVTKLSFRKSLSEGCQPNFGGINNDHVDNSFLPEVNIKGRISTNNIKDSASIGVTDIKYSSPVKNHNVVEANNGDVNFKTPKNSEYVIKTDNVTPMADYASMSTPQRNQELDKYGLKPLKRKRAIQILTHIYNQTHPTIQQLVEDGQPSPKKQRPNNYNEVPSPRKLLRSPRNSPSKRIEQSPKKTSPLNRKKVTTSLSPIKTDALERDRYILNSPSKNMEQPNIQSTSRSPIKFSPFKRIKETTLPSPIKTNTLERDGDILSVPTPRQCGDSKDVCEYEVTNKAAVIKSIDCNPDDWVFQKREKAKVHSCRVPLHIAFHNYVLSRRSLREAILKYEPVNIDVIHKDLVGYGHRYDPKDLLKFLDKKCITVKTTENNSRNNNKR